MTLLEIIGLMTLICVIIVSGAFALGIWGLKLRYIRKEKRPKRSIGISLVQGYFEDEIYDMMIEDGFNNDIPTIKGLYLIVFFTQGPYKDADIYCKNTTAGYTFEPTFHNEELSSSPQPGLMMAFASHKNTAPFFILSQEGINQMKKEWNTDDIWFKLIEETQ